MIVMFRLVGSLAGGQRGKPVSNLAELCLIYTTTVYNFCFNHFTGLLKGLPEQRLLKFSGNELVGCHVCQPSKALPILRDLYS